MSDHDDLARTRPDAPPADLTGEVPAVLLGRYRLAERIGRGGMATVYRAIDQQRDDRSVALKILLPAQLRGQANKERLINEARIVAKLKHPNIVELLDWGETPSGRVFLVLEYIEGEELKRLLRRRHILRWNEAAPILLQICSAMEAAHRAGIVHRDLKPENILLQRAGGFEHFVKLLDFGMAKMVDSAEAKRLTRTGMVVGTPASLAPEQIEGRAVDARTDVYALGVIMYRMLAGAMPFAHPNVLVLLQRQLRTPPVPPSRLNPAAPIPPAAETIVLKALAKAPGDRYGSMLELAEAIAQVAPLPARPPPGP